MQRKKTPAVAKPAPPPLSQPEIAERLRNSLVRFTAYATPAFHVSSIQDYRSYKSEFLGFLRLGKHKDDADRIIAICRKQKPVEGEHFTAHLVDRDGYAVPVPSVTLKDASDWVDARAEAARLLDIASMSLVTGKALEIYEWLMKPEHRDKKWSSRDLAERFKVDSASDLLWRLYFHHDSRVRVASEDRWSCSVQVAETPAPELLLPALNPVFPRISKEFTKVELETLRHFFEDLVLESVPDSDVFVVARIGTRTELVSSFPSLDDSALAPQNFYEALGKMPAVPGARLFYNFSHAQGPWIIGLHLDDDLSSWDDVRTEIKERRVEKSPGEKFGLSPMAGAVLAWLLDQDFESFDLHLSPSVRNALKLEIGIDLKAVGEKNFEELFDLLCREITEKTEFEARPVRWARDYYAPELCLFFRTKPGLEEAAVRAVQALLSIRGTCVDQEQIKAALEHLAIRPE